MQLWTRDTNIDMMTSRFPESVRGRFTAHVTLGSGVSEVQNVHMHLQILTDVLTHTLTCGLEWPRKYMRVTAWQQLIGYMTGV